MVDDDPTMRLISEATLNNLGYTVFVATGGNDAIKLLQKHRESIDCLLTDLSMPDMDGWETLAALRKIKPGLPAILSSGYDKTLAMSGDHDELPHAFLQKPYKKYDLENALGNLLGVKTKQIN